MSHSILLKGVKTHNLKDFDLVLPHHKLYVVTGVSGSGKSSLAFDTLYAEGQRRYVESLSAYARQFLERMEKPDVDFVSGIPPALAIEAKNVISNARSTVGTQTEINDYLRLLYARVGKTVCPDCAVEALKSQPEDILNYVMEKYREQSISILFPVNFLGTKSADTKASLDELERQGFSECYDQGRRYPLEDWTGPKKKQHWLDIICDQVTVNSKARKRLMDSLELAHRYGKGKLAIIAGKKRLSFSDELSCPSCSKSFREPLPNLFSFNSPLGACAECQGFGRVITLDWDLVVPDENKSLADGAIEPWTKPSAEWEFKHLLEYCRKKKIPLDKPWKSLPPGTRKLILHGKESDKFFSVRQYFDYLEKKTYKMHVRIFLSKYRTFVPCTACGESRLKEEGLSVKVSGRNIFELQRMPLADLYEFLAKLEFSESEKSRVEPVYVEIQKRVRFLVEVGLGYLSLARLSRTLSGGEMQRIHLASSLGSALVDTLYVLDEPSIGLHERDNELLIRLMKELRDLGNTLVVVEHDRMMIETADEVLDIGPGGGERGGQLLYQGEISGLHDCRQSLTGRYLSGELIPGVARKNLVNRASKEEWVQIIKAAEHNLKNINVAIPLKQFVVITGVSGSGKSTLVYDVLYKNFLRSRGQSVQEPGKVQKIKGFEKIDQLVLVDQSPIGRSPRSNPVTYIGVYEDIRKIFASTGDAKKNGLQASAFSFNVDGGRCEICKGAGQVKIEMHFLADVYMLCETCQGKRFKKHVLDVRYQGKNIDHVLALTVEEAVDFFKGSRPIVEKLSLLVRVGLGYLRLGQSATTLSGGEAQRLKLAEEMANSKEGHVLYVFDEPTTGLHYHDIHFLLQAFQELLERGHSLLVIEHNMEVIHTADWIIDLGPDGGEQGGSLVFSGTCDELVTVKESFTGKYLRKHRDRLKQFSKPVKAAV